MFLFTLTTLLALSAASPTPTNLVPRCGTTLEPTSLQIVSEEEATTSFVTGVDFSATNNVSKRESTIVTFNNIPSTATTCTLNIILPSSSTLTSSHGRNPQVNIFTFTPPAFTTQHDWSWNKIYSPDHSTQSLKGMSLFGTVTIERGKMQTVNSMACSENMGFLFEVANWEAEGAFVRFAQGFYSKGGDTQGVVLTHSC